MDIIDAVADSPQAKGLTADRLLSRRGAILLAGGLGALFVVLFAWPVGRVLAEGLRPAAVREVLRDSRIRSVAWFSLWQAAASTVAAVGIAIPIAAVVAKTEFPGRRFTLGLLSAPFALPAVVVGTSILLVSPRSIRGTAGIIICAHILYNVGFVARSLTAALEHLGSNPFDAARSLGATPTRALLTVELPLLRGTLKRVAGVVFGLCFASFGTVLILGGPRRSTLDVEIHRQVFQFGRLDRSAVVAIIQLVILTFVLVRTQRQGRRDDLPNSAFRARRGRPQTATGWLGVISVIVVAVAGVVLPLAGVLRRAFRNPNGAIGFENFRRLTEMTRGSGLATPPISALWVSIRAAILVGTLAILTSTLVALVSNQNSQRWLAQVLTIAPLATSPVTLGLGVLLGFAVSPVAWRSSPVMLLCIQTIVCLPFALATMTAASSAIPRQYLDSAATLGASPLQVQRTVWLPLLSGTLRAASGTVFAVALGEFGAASILVRPSSETLPVVIARLATKPGVVLTGQAAALALLLGALTAFATGLTVSGRVEP